MFYYEMLEDGIDVSNLGDRECYYISLLHSLVPNGYNVRRGGNDSGARPIFQVKPFTGEIIKEYPSLTSASVALHIDLSQLSKVCRANNTSKSCAGYLWCFIEDYDKVKLANIRPHFLNRPLYQIEQGSDKIIHRWDSVRDACKNIGVNQASLSMCLSGKYRTAGGFCWCYCDLFQGFVKQASTRFVVQIDKITNSIIGEYKSAQDASMKVFGDYRHTQAIRCSCNPNCIQKSAYGYIWRYKDLYEKAREYPNDPEDRPNSR